MRSGTPPAIVAITGLAAEARIARRAGIAALAGGGDAERTAAIAAEAIAGGARLLLSFGIAGGLAPDLAPGDLVLASAVVDAAGTRIDAAVLPAAGAPLVRRGALYGSDAIVASATEKRRLHAATGALALDLETHLVARAAAAAGIPWTALRAVADPASRDLPPAALVGLRPDGSPDLPAVLASLARRPGQFPQLLRVARDSAAGLAALRRVGAVPGLFRLLGVDAGDRLLDVP